MDVSSPAQDNIISILDNPIEMHIKTEIKQEIDENFETTDTNEQLKPEPYDYEQLQLKFEAQCQQELDIPIKIERSESPVKEAEFYDCGQPETDVQDKSTELQDRYITMTQKRTQACKLCDSRYITMFHLRRHLKRHTENLSDGYNCRLCEEKFTTQYALLSHLWTHHDIEMHKCEICGKEFAKEESLKAHSGTHSTSLQCNVSEKVFSTVEGYQTEFGSHAKEYMKKFACTMCDKVFATR